MTPSSGARIPVPWKPKDVALGVVVVIALAGAIVGLLTVLYRRENDTSFVAALVGSVVLELAMLGTAMGLAIRSGAPISALFGPRRYTTLGNFKWGAVAFAGSVIVGAIYVAIASAISDDLTPTPLPIDIPESGLRWLVFVMVVLIGPFAEETFFRGFVFAGLLQRYGAPVAVLASAALFAAAHVDLAVVGPAFLSGTIYALVYWRTGSLWPTVLAHTAQNAVAFALAMPS